MSRQFAHFSRWSKQGFRAFINCGINKSHLLSDPGTSVIFESRTWTEVSATILTDLIVTCCLGTIYKSTVFFQREKDLYMYLPWLHHNIYHNFQAARHWWYSERFLHIEQSQRTCLSFYPIEINTSCLVFVTC